MSRFNFLTSIVCVLFVSAFLSAGAYADDDETIFIAQATPPQAAAAMQTPKAPAPISVRRPAPRKVARKTRTRTEIGLGYLAWNDDFTIRSATDKAQGVASFGGVAFFVEQSWFLKRWQLGINLVAGSGKAAANVSGNITYSDGTNRAWTAVLIEPFARYAINNYILFGAGLLYKHQSIDWTTADTTLTLDPKNTQITGQFDMKVAINKHWSITQSYAPLGFKGRSLWFTSGSYAF